MNEPDLLKDIRDIILQTLIGLEIKTEDTVWVGPVETLFDRLINLHIMAGGNIEELNLIFPECGLIK